MLLNLFFILALLVFIVASYRRPILGLGTIIVLLPSYLWRFEILSLPTTFLELMILSLFVIWLIKDQKFKNINFLLKQNSNNLIPKQLKWFLTLWLIAGLMALAINPAYSSLGLWRAYFLEPIMFFLVFIYTVKNKTDYKIIINSLALLILWLFSLTMFQYFSNWNFIAAYNYPQVQRATALFAYPNALSLLVAPLAALFFGLWVEAKNKTQNYLYFLITFLASTMAYLAVSQGAMTAIAFSIFIWLILAKKIRKFGIPLAILAIIIMVIIVPIDRHTISEKVLSLNFNPVVSPGASSLNIRFNQWNETIDLLGDNFILGVGLNGYQESLVNYHQYQWLEIFLYPHNIFLNFWVELGLFGLFVFLALIVYVMNILIQLFKAKSVLAWPLCLTWLTFLIHGLVDVPYFKNDLSILFFIILGLTLFAYNNKQFK